MIATAAKKRPAVAYFYDPTLHEWDRKVIELARRGFAVDTIARRTRLTYSQVYYRMRKEGISPWDYRRGESDTARSLLVSVDVAIDKLQLEKNRSKAERRRKARKPEES